MTWPEKTDPFPPAASVGGLLPSSGGRAKAQNIPPHLRLAFSLAEGTLRTTRRPARLPALLRHRQLNREPEIESRPSKREMRGEYLFFAR